MATDWSAVLDVLEERIEVHRKVLVGAQSTTDYELPDDLGPLPLALVGRACVILARQQELEAELEDQMEALRNLFYRNPAERPIALYVDQRA